MIIKNDRFSEDECLQMVKRDGWAIQYIKNSSEKIQLAAVKEYGWAIQCIENPSETVQLEAIKIINNIYYIDNYITSKKAKEKWHDIQQMKKACL